MPYGHIKLNVYSCTLILTRLSSSSFLPQQNFSLPQSKVKQSMPPGVFKMTSSHLSDIMTDLALSFKTWGKSPLTTKIQQSRLHAIVV